tara:strand:+ start:89 stop:1396 length:1308 start_codon:yes stop_codon:yes gene_type:complete
MESDVVQKACRGKVVNLATSKASVIDFMLRDQRRLWNWVHDLNVARHRDSGEFIFYNEAAALLTKERGNGTFADGSVVAQQQCLRSYERALKSSFPNSNNRQGFPKPRKHANQCSLRFPAKDVRTVRNGEILSHVKLPKIGLLRVRNIVVPIGAKINSYCLKHEADGYWLSVQYTIVVDPPINNNPNTVGIDAGLSVMASFSNGEQVHALKPLRKARKKLCKAQRSLARKRRGSVNRRRQAKRVARVHAKVRHARRNAQHQLSRRLVDENGLIAIETLSLSGLKRLKHQGFAWSDIGFGELYRHLRYKTNWAGGEIYEHPRFARSTGCCPDCRHIGPKIDLRIRNWTCTQCGVRHDRDIAAARWLELCALEHRAQVGAACPEPVEVKPRPKRGSSGSAPRTIAVMRSAPFGSPVHGGSPANGLSDVRCLASASTG